MKDPRPARKRSQLPSGGLEQIILDTQQRDIQEVKLIRHEQKMIEVVRDDVMELCRGSYFLTLD